jgi:hypothetical protein
LRPITTIIQSHLKFDGFARFTMKQRIITKGETDDGNSSTPETPASPTTPERPEPEPSYW